MGQVDPESALGRFLGRAGWSRVSPGVLVAALVLCAALLTLATVRWWPGGGAADAGFAIEEPSAGLGEGAEVAEEAAGAHAVVESAVEPTSVVVHVAGAVMRPGLITLGAGSRCGDAVDAAGGLLGNAAASAINLARPVADGEQIYIPTLDEVEAGTQAGVAGGALAGGAAAGGTGAAGSAGGSASALVDLNSATAEQLDALPGIGPATATKIVADREANGPFSTIDEIQRVSGIGAKKFESLKDLIVVR